MSDDPKTFHFDLPTGGKPQNVWIPEQWYPGIKPYWPKCTSSRIYHPIEGVRAVVIHATAGQSSEGAISVMTRSANRSSFHWLIPDEDEAQHGQLIWACAPEMLAAWHVRNDVSHGHVNGGAKKTNHWSLGIEIVNRQVGSDAFSSWQVEMAAKIVRYAWEKYPNLRHVVSHAMLDPARRTDPGALFPWDQFRTHVLSGADDPIADLIALTTPAGEIAATDSSDPCC
jgi:N-acetylmuramoyl-L-alanine amidase